MEKSSHPKYPLPGYLQQDKERERLSRFQLERRNLIGRIIIGASVFGGCGMIAWAVGTVTHNLRTAQCVNCGPSSDNPARLDNNNINHDTSTKTYEYNGILYEPMQKLSPVTLPFTLTDSRQAQGDVIAPRGSTEGNTVPLLPGSAMFIALWHGTMQYGCLNGDVGWLRRTVSQDTAVFHDYLHRQQDQQSQPGYPGQVLWIDFDQQSSQMMPGATCNQPAYCITPNEAGELAYAAGVLTPDVNRAHGAAFLNAVLADSRFGGNPEKTTLIASQITW